MKKFFLVHLFDDYSGSPRILASLSDVLSQSNTWHELVVGSGSVGFLSELNVRSNKFLYKRSGNKIFTLFFYLISQFFLFLLVLRLCFKHRRDDNVFIINTLLPFGGALAARLCRAKVYYYCHEVSLRPRILLSFLTRVLNLTAHKIVYVSNYVKTQLSINQIISQKVIYNPLHSSFCDSILNKDDLESKWRRKIILMVCSLKAYKGVNEFLSLARNFLHLNDYKFLLVLNETHKNAGDFYAETCLPSNFSYVCRPDNLVHLYQNSFLVINLSHPDSWIETFGLTLLEGMSQYNPVISPVVGGPTEFVVNYINGFQLSHEDLCSIKDVISSLGSNYDSWLKLALSAKETSEKFSLENYACSINDYLIKDLC